MKHPSFTIQCALTAFTVRCQTDTMPALYNRRHPNPGLRSDITFYCILIEKSKDLASDVFPPGLLVIHNPGGGGQDNVTELPGWKEIHNPLLEIMQLAVVS